MPTPLRFTSWNVNGIRAASRAGFAEYIARTQPDVLCLQEVKATPQDIDAAEILPGYDLTWNCAQKKGYSGVLIATREKPIGVNHGLGLPEHDTEGRVLTAEFPDFSVVNVYTPNSQRGLARLDYRLQWDAAFLAHLRALDGKKPVLCCGDFNVSHEEIDLANPKENRKNAGFSDEERASFSALLAAGFTDTFRAAHPEEKGHYSWWTYRMNARERNIGWRLDYWLVSNRLAPRVQSPTISPEVQGSDHCPVGMLLA